MLHDIGIFITFAKKFDMLTIGDAIKFLSDYRKDAELVLPDGSDIKHIGMLFTDDSPIGYKVILAHERPVDEWNPQKPVDEWKPQKDEEEDNTEEYEIFDRLAESNQYPENRKAFSQYSWNSIPFPFVVGDSVNDVNRPLNPIDRDFSDRIAWRIFTLTPIKFEWKYAIDSKKRKEQPRYWRPLTDKEKQRFITKWQEIASKEDIPYYELGNQIFRW